MLEQRGLPTGAEMTGAGFHQPWKLEREDIPPERGKIFLTQEVVS